MWTIQKTSYPRSKNLSHAERKTRVIYHPIYDMNVFAAPKTPFVETKKGYKSSGFNKIKTRKCVP